MSSARISSRAMFITWSALILLAAASFFFSTMHLGRLGVPVALAIAIAKAALVAIVFMELAVQRASNRAAFVAAIAFVALLASLAVVDVVTRAAEPASVPAPSGVIEPHAVDARDGLR
jgi:cytochrome c oxidase subunit 4